MGSAYFPPSLGRTGPNARDSERLPSDRSAWVHRGSTSFAVTMKDASRSGACFISPLPLSVGRQIRLQLGHQTSFAAFDAVVVRHAERTDGQHEIGVRFDRMQRDVDLREPQAAPGRRQNSSR